MARHRWSAFHREGWQLHWLIVNDRPGAVPPLSQRVAAHRVSPWQRLGRMTCMKCPYRPLPVGGEGGLTLGPRPLGAVRGAFKVWRGRPGNIFGANFRRQQIFICCIIYLENEAERMSNLKRAIGEKCKWRGRVGHAPPWLQKPLWEEMQQEADKKVKRLRRRRRKGTVPPPHPVNRWHVCAR